MSAEEITTKFDKNELSSHFQYQELIVSGNKYLVGVCKVNDIRHILLTDLKNFYEEKLSKEDGIKRAEDLNPLLSDCDFNEILDDLLLNIPKYTTSSTLECIELENQIEDGRFWFHIKLTKTDPQPHLNQFTENLYTSFSELYFRYSCLLDLIGKKDKEIDEYRAQGANIVKKSLMTEPFNESLFGTKRKKTEVVEKMNIFLKTMEFYNSIKRSQSSEDVKKNEPSPSQTEIVTEISEIPSEVKKVAKKPSSGDIRCAVIPKIGKKNKQSNKNLFLKHI